MQGRGVFIGDIGDEGQRGTGRGCQIGGALSTHPDDGVRLLVAGSKDGDETVAVEKPEGDGSTTSAPHWATVPCDVLEPVATAGPAGAVPLPVAAAERWGEQEARAGLLMQRATAEAGVAALATAALGGEGVG